MNGTGAETTKVVSQVRGRQVAIPRGVLLDDGLVQVVQPFRPFEGEVHFIEDERGIGHQFMGFLDGFLPGFFPDDGRIAQRKGPLMEPHADVHGVEIVLFGPQGLVHVMVGAQELGGLVEVADIFRVAQVAPAPGQASCGQTSFAAPRETAPA